MKRRPKQIRTKLLDLVRKMSEHPDAYLRSPGKDFTRKRKLPFEKMIGTLLCMKGGSLNCELLDAFGCSVHTATSSATLWYRKVILRMKTVLSAIWWTEPMENRLYLSRTEAMNPSITWLMCRKRAGFT